MQWKSWQLAAVVFAVLGPPLARAGDLRIPLPARSKTTPVQQLNRDGVEALKKNHLDKAKSLFYRAYLFDPEDPFTLNNLGYVAELEGRVDRAQRFYELAGQSPSEAIVDKASTRSLEGKTVAEVAGNVQDKNMQVNRQNFEAIRLLSLGRAPEAEMLLRTTLRLDPGNPYTLNNYAVASEMEGDYEKALTYYNAAAKSGSNDPVIVTLDTSWRGKPVSEMAAQGAKRVRERMQREQSVAAQVRRLNLQGVSALNRNARYDARRYFEEAYTLDPNNAFVLNNRGYLAEMDGDSETAQLFYEKARRSDDANARIGLATQRAAEGKKLFEVADQNDRAMGEEMAREQAARRRRSGPVRLKHRDSDTKDQPQLQTQPEDVTPSLGPPQPPVPQLTPRP